MGSCLGKCLLNSESMLRSRTSRQNSEHDSVFLINEKSRNISEGKRCVLFVFILVIKSVLYIVKSISKCLLISCCVDCRRNFLYKLFKKRKSLKHPKKPVLELVDGLINAQSPLYSRLNESQRFPSTSYDIPMQCLDARVLLAKTRTSTPASSLDLEWEHETLPISMVHDPSATSSWTAFPGDDLTTDPCASYCCCDEDVTASVTTHNGECCTHDDVEMATAAVALTTLDTERSWSRISSANSLEWDNNVPATINLLHMSSSDGDEPTRGHLPVSLEDQADRLSETPELDEIRARGELYEHVELELDEVDAIQLLSEIERLTKQTLEETGKDLDCASLNS